MNETKQPNITHHQLSSKLPDVIKISTVGMSERSIQRISAMFTIVFKGRCKLVDPDEAMIALIDINAESVSQNIMESCQDGYSSLPSIVLVKNSSEKDHNNVRYLEKPLKREEFWAAIVSLFERTEQLKKASEKASRVKTSNSAAELDNLLKKESSAPKIAPRVEDKSKQSIFYDPKKYLIGYIQDLLSQQYPPDSVLKLEFAYKYRIFLYPDLKMALSNLSDSHYRNIAIMPFTNNQMCQLNIEQNADLQHDLLSHKEEFSKITIDGLLWTLALRTSRGRVPELTSVNKPVYLHSWPNLTRLCTTPHAMRIASLWLNNPRSLYDIALSLGIDNSDIFSFYSAAFTIGIAGKSKRESDIMIEPRKVEANKKRGLFSAILSRFKKPVDKETR